MLALYALGALLEAPAHAEVFVDVARAEALIAEGAAVIDARGPKPWKAGHLPGSRPVAWTSIRDGLLRTGLLSSDLDTLGHVFSAAGVREDRPVVVYGAAQDGWGEEGRLFWTLEYLGHPDVHVLDGGYGAWVAAGKAVSTVEDPVAMGLFTPAPRPGRRATLAEVEAALGREDVVLWDTREAREFAGETPYGEARGGHLPGAVHLWYADLMGPDGTLKPEDELRAALEARGITPDKQIVPLCTGGVRSGFAYAVLRELGYPQVANYDGSMWEWAAGDGALER
ncbi:MAG: sulfurtransferase [Alphaproteobacteria bacterium]|nr:sulfurtransferase [Alphaproteobacteria bacterium]